MRVLLFLLLSVPVLAQTDNWRAKTAPELLAAFDRNSTIDLLVVFQQQADVADARYVRGKNEKAQWVFDKLQQTAQSTQSKALHILRQHNAAANSLFVVNAIAVKEADAALAQALAALPEVARLSPDPWIELDLLPTETPNAATNRNAVEWGIARINAPSVWAMGYTGQGITVGGADTGYYWVHPALQPHYRGWDTLTGTANHAYNWFDGVFDKSPLNADSLNPCGFRSQQPCDDGSHGTHTMGTMAGDDGLGNQVGVAPGAQWIGCRNMERNWGRPSTYLNCFEFFLAPTDVEGNNPKPDRAPQVINNSWYCSDDEGCTDVGVNDLLRLAVVNLKASGVFVVVSNGNFGSGCVTANIPPAYFEESFSVGSIKINDTISGFSSRGPITIDSSFRVKPNVSAPGTDVRSSVPNGGYDSFSGTSMAGPHVVGLVALVLSAAPELAGEVELLETIIEETARPKFDGPNCFDNNADDYPNNTYGFGIVDALAAVLRAQQVVAVQEAAPAFRVQVAPNPAQSATTFLVNGTQGTLQLDIFNALGDAMYKNAAKASAEHSLRIELEAWPAGVYFYRLQDAKTTQTGTFVKS
ncbi:MAG: S8 family peptidase [Saprospiraceae bacterium]